MGPRQLFLYQSTEASRPLWIGDVVVAVHLCQGVGQDVHAVRLVVKDLPRLFVRLHIAGHVADELSEGDVAIFRKGVASLFRAFPCRYVHHLRIVVAYRCVCRRYRPLVNGDAEDVRVQRLGRRRNGHGPGAVVTEIPLCRHHPVAHDDGSARTLSPVGLQPLPRRLESRRLESDLFGAGSAAIRAREM